MRKCIWLSLLVLGISTTAWGACQIDVAVNPSAPTCENTVYASIDICCSGACTFESRTVRRIGNQIYIDVYLECTCPHGCTDLPHLGPQILDKPCCGLYVVVVRVWCTYTYWPYCLFQRPIFCGLGSTSVRVCCPCCGCYPCCCWMTPTCPAPEQ